MSRHLFTSESVTGGHPDKLSDQVSDAILDAYLQQDPTAKVACETATKTGFVMVFGEIKTDESKNVNVPVEKIVRDTVRDIGYTSSDMGFDADSCAVMNVLGEQSADINQGVDRGDPQGTGRRRPGPDVRLCL